MQDRLCCFALWILFQIPGLRFYAIRACTTIVVWLATISTVMSPHHLECPLVSDFRYVLKPLCSDPSWWSGLFSDKLDLTFVFVNVPMGPDVQSTIVYDSGFKYNTPLSSIGRVRNLDQVSNVEFLSHLLYNIIFCGKVKYFFIFSQ